MANWYDKYLSIYGKLFSEVPQEIIDGTRERLAALQSDHPIASIVVIGYNEETHLQACLWAISEIKCKYPVEIIGVDNDSKDRTAEIYEKSGIPYYTEYQHSCGYARRCGLQHSRGKYYFDVDSDTIYPPQYYEIMLEHLMKPGVVAVSVVTDGVDGYLVRDRSIGDFVNKVCLLMEDEELGRRMGQKGVLSAQRYEANQVMPRWKVLFEQLCTK